MHDLSKLDIKQLANLANIPSNEFDSFVRKAPYLYSERQIPKSKGGYRLIEAPHPILKKVQGLILHSVFEHLPVNKAFFGRKGTNFIDAVIPHVQKPLVLTMDIESFFPSVSKTMVLSMLRKRGTTRDVAEAITRIVTRKNHLPQGAPTSSCVAALVLNPAVDRICAVLKSIRGASVSIYVDDVTISGPLGLKRIKGTIRKILKDSGFDLHPDKTRIMPHKTDQLVLGIRVNKGPEPTVEYLAEYEKCKKNLGVQHPSVLGMAAYIRALGKARRQIQA